MSALPRPDQHATRPDVADLVGALCIRAAGDRVLDPACGAGAFLIRAAARLEWLGARGGAAQLSGVEIDPDLARAARRRLRPSRIVTGDFLELAQRGAAAGALGASDPYDAVIGNPPYVRQELLPAWRKRALASLAAGGPARQSLRSDLHVYFWAPSLRLLRDGGRLGLVTSSAWLDAGYGEPLRRWLEERCRVVAIVESEAESWFDRARVRTVIVVVEKSGPSGVPPRLVRLLAPLEDLVPGRLPRDERLARFGDLARGIESGRAPPFARRGMTMSEPPAAAIAGCRWGALLRQPAAYGEILGKGAGRLVPLEQIATVRWGIKTGDDRFFFVRDEENGEVEERFLAPAVFSLMELRRLVVSADQVRRRLVLIDLRETPPAALEGTRLARRIAAAERERRTHLRPTCAAREGRWRLRRWFELRPGPPAEILWSVMHQYRHLAPINAGALPANDNLLLLRTRPGVRADLLAALLNSFVQALIKQMWGRRRNEGMLKTQASDVRRMLVPDPRLIDAGEEAAILAAFGALCRRPVGAIPEECRREDRRALDLAVVRALGWRGAGAEAMVRRVHDTLVRSCRRERAWELDARVRLTRSRPARSAGS